MIEFYVLRHAKAKSHQSWGNKDDSKRPLTRSGEKEMWRVAKAMKQMGLEFDLILSSPFVRARRTAEIVREVFNSRPKFKLTAALAADADPGQFLRQGRKLLGSAQKIVTVGHDPFLSEMISLLLAGKSNAGIELDKAGMCKLTSESLRAGSGTLHWLLTPEQLKAMR